MELARSLIPGNFLFGTSNGACELPGIPAPRVGSAEEGDKVRHKSDILMMMIAHVRPKRVERSSNPHYYVTCGNEIFLYIGRKIKRQSVSRHCITWIMVYIDQQMNFTNQWHPPHLIT